MNLETLPLLAREIIADAAGNFGVEPAAIFGAWRRPPAADAARVTAISKLANATMDDGRHWFDIADLMAWFECSRRAIYRYRERSGDLGLRRPPRRRALKLPDKPVRSKKLTSV